VRGQDPAHRNLQEIRPTFHGPVGLPQFQPEIIDHTLDDTCHPSPAAAGHQRREAIILEQRADLWEFPEAGLKIGHISIDPRRPGRRGIITKRAAKARPENPVLGRKSTRMIRYQKEPPMSR